jgi:hypothetical protein
MLLPSMGIGESRAAHRFIDFITGVAKKLNTHSQVSSANRAGKQKCPMPGELEVRHRARWNSWRGLKQPVYG